MGFDCPNHKNNIGCVFEHFTAALINIFDEPTENNHPPLTPTLETDSIKGRPRDGLLHFLPVTTLGILVMKLLTVLMGTPSVSSWM